MSTQQGHDRFSQPPIAPIYWLDAPGQTIDLGTERVSFVCRSRVHETTAQVQLRLVPDNRLVFLVQCDNEYPPVGLALISEGQNGLKLRLVDRNVDVGVFFVSTEESSRLVFIPKRSAVDVRPPAKSITYAIAHLFNFPDFQGPGSYGLVTGEVPTQNFRLCGRAFLRAGGWKITIAATDTTSRIVESLGYDGGYAITHVVRFEREDRPSFSAEELTDLLPCLHVYLTFVLGRWAGLALPVGFDAAGGRVFEQWGMPMASAGPWSGACSWLDEQHGELLNQVFPGFVAKWRDPLWGRAIKEAVYWYAGACERGTGIGVDTGLVLAQTALELLAWTYCTQDKGLLSEESFRKLPASDKMRLLFGSLGIPQELPDGLEALAAAPGRSFADSAEAIAGIRNAIVHPHAKRELPHDSYGEAWKLALWYIDMVLLRLCGHNGHYAKRLFTRWVGNTEAVPWAAGVSETLTQEG